MSTLVMLLNKVPILSKLATTQMQDTPINLGRAKIVTSFVLISRKGAKLRKNYLKSIGYPNQWRGKKKGQKLAKRGQYTAATNLIISNLLDLSDSTEEWECRIQKKDSDVTTCIQQKVSKEVARIMRGKAHQSRSETQQQVNFFHLGEFKGNSQTKSTYSILANSQILDIGLLAIYVVIGLCLSP